jgi:SAM-dependent methyltransferase
MALKEFYVNGEYLENNPQWHVEASPWKASSILEMIERNKLSPRRVCEIGCGAGEILRILQRHLDSGCEFWGYEIAPQAIELAKSRENERIHFKLGDMRDERNAYYDLILIIDVLEHFEDCFKLLRDIRSKSEYKILQLPLDVFVASVLRNELIDYRHTTGHLHFFTKDIALELLKDNGYEVLDYFYTLPPLDTTSWSEVRGNPFKLARKLIRVVKMGLQRLPGQLAYKINEDLAVRIFGGWRLVVLVR